MTRGFIVHLMTWRTVSIRPYCRGRGDGSPWSSPHSQLREPPPRARARGGRGRACGVRGEGRMTDRGRKGGSGGLSACVGGRGEKWGV